MARTGDRDLDARLDAHLATWVGEWPPPSPSIHVVGDPARLEPTWDGTVRPLLGVGNGVGTVIAVPPRAVRQVRELLAGGFRAGIGDELGAVMDVGPARFGTGVFRWTTAVDGDIADLGDWHERQSADLPAWLAPFNGPRLVVRGDDGAVVAGVGIKVHDRYGHEIAVVTEHAARGRGIARRLVATAARRILAEGGVPTYLHDPGNLASAHVADAVGFRDHGWTVHGLWPVS